MPLEATIVLVRTQEEGNIGSTARAMANTGLCDLVLVAPKAEIGDTARAFAVGARGILDRARRFATLEQALAPFRRVVGTTSERGRVGSERTLAPRELPGLLASDAPEADTAVVFGPEASGLLLDELALCSAIVRVPCAPEQPTLNLSQAVLIVGYELFMARLAGDEVLAAAQPPATSEEIAGLLAHAQEVLEGIGFARDDTFDGVLRDLRALVARAAPSEREVRILRGICRRGLRSLATDNDPEAA